MRYVLEGSVRKAATACELRVSSSSSNRQTYWTERFERKPAEIFDLQDEISESIVGAVAPEILDAEVRHARSKRPYNLVAYDCVLRAYQHLWIFTLDDNDKALDFLRQAIRLDPDYALAYAYASWADLFRVQLL